MNGIVRYSLIMGLALLLSAGVSPARADEQGQKGQQQKQQKQQMEGHQEGVQGEDQQGLSEGQEGQKQKYKQKQKIEQKAVRPQGQAETVLLPKDTISNLQRILRDRGFYKGNIDGMAGPQTKSGLRQFQQQSNIDTTARLDDETVRQLGLTLPGSEMRPVRGVSPEEQGQGMQQRFPREQQRSEEHKSDVRQESQQQHPEQYKGDVPKASQQQQSHQETEGIY